MMVSTRGRYALRVMILLADRTARPETAKEYVSVKEISERERISKKYLESIMTILSKAGLAEGVTGKKGGFRLGKEPEEITVGSILRLTEGTMAPVACLEAGATPCERRPECRTFPIWQELDRRIEDYLGQVTLRDLMLPQKE